MRYLNYILAVLLPFVCISAPLAEPLSVEFGQSGLAPEGFDSGFIEGSNLHMSGQNYETFMLSGTIASSPLPNEISYPNEELNQFDKIEDRQTIVYDESVTDILDSELSVSSKLFMFSIAVFGFLVLRKNQKI